MSYSLDVALFHVLDGKSFALNFDPKVIQTVNSIPPI